MEKINIAELLKDCPKGMELDCTLFDDVKFEECTEECIYIRLNNGELFALTIYGNCLEFAISKCVIFPKGETTWDGFVPPCNFKAGDVLVSENGNIVLLSHIDSENVVNYHCIIPTYGSFRIEENTSIGVGRYYECVLANEQQRQRMYDKIKCSGYKYNQSTNKLEKLTEPKFKVGDRVKTIYGDFQYDIKELTDTHYTLVEVENKYEYTEPIIEDKNWELVPNKFDINTLIPFESKVLVRGCNSQEWVGEIFTRYNNKVFDNCNFVTLGGICWKQCIPYNDDTKHLLGTTDDCNEFYKTWEI